MKNSMLLAVLFAASAAPIRAQLLSVPGLAEAVAAGAKSAKAVGLVDLNGDAGIGGFLPVRTYHDNAGIAYVEAGPGAAIKQAEHAKGGVLVDFDLSAIVRKIEGRSAWYQAHTDKIALPDVWVGPYVFPALDSSFRWDHFREYVGGTLTIRL